MPNDAISIQHDAGPGTFLFCHPNLTPAYQMSYLTLNSSDWNPDSSTRTAAGSWHNDSVCYIRVLYTTEETIPIISKENSGVAGSGFYTVRATVSNGVFSTNLSCNVLVVSPVSDLRVIYPPVQEGIIYMPTNHTWLVVKIFTGANATSGWFGGNQSFPFERSCPSSVALLTTACARETDDTWFSVITLDGIGENVSTVVLWAENAVSSQNISVQVKAEEPIRGLRATPNPESRVLLHHRVVSHLKCAMRIIFFSKG